MPTLNRPRSAILTLLPFPQSLSQLEAMELAWPLDSKIQIQDLTAEVLIAPVEILLTDSFLRLWKSLRQKNVGTQLIVIADTNTPSEFIVESQKELPIFRLYESLDETDLEWGIFEAIEKSSLLKQNEQLHLLVQDQTEKLKNLYHELEERVQKRQRYLEESRRKSLIAQFRWQTLKLATETILEAGSVLEMERALTQILQEALNLIQVRILLRQQSSLAQSERAEPKIAIHRVRLFQDNDVLLGYSVFMRDEAWPFSLEEKDFLHKISEAISLAIRRLNQVEITRTLREQWAATFNAITEPVALVRENYEIIQSNTAFQQRFKDTSMPRVPLGQFVRTEPTRQRPESWEITSQSMTLTPGDTNSEPLYFMQFHEITERLRIERKLLEGARLAELGIIGSSIAHELNNPLGGILSFVQMMRMDLPKDHPLRPDVDEMEAGVFRCRDIVQNLLGFTRSSEMDAKKDFDIRDALNRAISILELQTRSAGIEIRRQLPEKPQMVHGHTTLISQAFANLLQNSLQNLATTPGKSQPQLEVAMADLGSEVEIRIIDNAPALQNSPTGAAPTLSLPLAQQIFLDHDAAFEILLPGRGLRLVKISVPKASLTDSQ